ncbi:MAG: hypothetical protein LBE38_00735 [Deltaproteobacteria bacterium]|jgi:hypothetical protein|nr:hypothetical protein [Deltaproteobacteria bacterium]
MNFDNMASLLQTSGAQAFKDNIVDQLIQGNNVIVYLPDYLIVDNLMKSINDGLRKNGIPKINIANAANYDGPPTLTALMSAQPEMTKALRKKHFADYFKSSSKDMLLIRGIVNLDKFPSESYGGIYKELTEACQATRSDIFSGKKPAGLRYLVVLSPRFPAFPNMEGTVSINWWGVTSNIDHMVLFKKAINSLETKPTESMYWWLKAVCMGVGDDDPWLISELVNKMPMELSEISDIIKSHPLNYSHSKTLTPQFEPEAQFLLTGVSHEYPPPPENNGHRVLWAKGLLNPGGLCAYHPVVLAQNDTLLMKFVISGQVHVFFPLVEQVKDAIIQIVESRLGEGVWEHYIPLAKAREDMMFEIGPLSYHLKKNINPTDSRLSFLVNEMANLAYHWSKVRHLSAHHRICPYSTLENAIKLYHEAEKYLDKNCPIGMKHKTN